MRIGIICYSETGHTAKVVKRLAQRLAGMGHEVAEERIVVVGKPRGTAEVAFTGMPDPTRHDALVCAAPVHGAALARAMAAYLDQIPSLDGVQVACLLTQSFPWRFLRATGALESMRAALVARGVVVGAAEIVTWMGRGREARIAAAIELLAKPFG